MRALQLENRVVISLSGGDAESLLQGLITNDIRMATDTRVIYAALLTPQGKYLFDFFIAWHGESFLLDAEAARKDDLIKRLMFYRLRAEAKIEDTTADWRAWAVLDGPEELAKAGDAAPFMGGTIYRDPRLAGMGWRAILPKEAALPGGLSPDEYETLRLGHGIPDSSRDMEPDKRFILEANFRELNGVDFEKGCYVGQEMTARMNYRGSLKKRLLPVEVSGALPKPGTPITAGGKEAGYILSGQGSTAIALVRLEFARKENLEASGTAVKARFPPWLKGKAEKD